MMDTLTTDVQPGMASLTQDAPYFEALHAEIEHACSQACQAIAPAWPLDRAIAVNPHWSRIGMPVRRVAARMAALGGIQVFPPRDQQLRAWREGRIGVADLTQALRQLPEAREVGLSPAHRINLGR